MDDNLTSTVVVVALCVVLTFISIQNTSSTYENEVTIEESSDSVFSFLKEPKNLMKVQETITHVEVTEKSSHLDEEDGHLKEIVEVVVTQNFPHWKDTQYNFTRVASTANHVINTDGYVLGVYYTTEHNILKKGNTQTQLKERTTITCPRILSWMISSQVKQGMIDRMSKLKQVIENK